jgi:hypothetical protein
MDNIIKNPTFIAVVAGVITYTYIVWKKKQNKRRSKKQINDKNEVIMAGVVALLVWFIVYGYLNYKKSIPTGNYLMHPQQVPTYRLVQDISETPKSFTLMNPTGGIAFPAGNQNMPDLFIDQF